MRARTGRLPSLALLGLGALDGVRFGAVVPVPLAVAVPLLAALRRARYWGVPRTSSSP